MAGHSPLAGSLVELYAAGLAGNGSAPSQLLAAAAVTDTGGAFQVAAGSYSCPSSTSLLYLVAAGGEIGTQTVNAGVSFMTVLGTCGSLGQGAAVVVNEVTTTAAAFAFRPFLSPGGQLGSTATNPGGLLLAYGTFAALVNPATGSVPGATVPANGTPPRAKLDTIANLLHGCASAASSTAPACAGLFQGTANAGTTPANTLDAALSLASHPGEGVASLFLLASQAQLFLPSLPVAPPDWTLAFTFTGGGMSGPTTVSIDSVGRIWVANYFDGASLFANSGTPLFAAGVTGDGLHEVYGGAVDSTDRMWLADEESADASVNGGKGTLTVLTGSGPGAPQAALLSSGGLNFPIAVAFDRSGQAWVIDNGDASLTLLDSAGHPLSGANGYTSTQFAFPVAVAVDAAGAGWVANSSSSTLTRVTADGGSFASYTVGDGPAAVAVDAGNNVWSANYRGDSVGLVAAGGQVLSNGGFTGGGLNHPTGIAVDGAGTAWIANYRSPGISVFAGEGASVPGAALSAAGGWGADLSLVEAYGIAVDAAGDVWVSSSGDNRLIKFVGAAAPVQTPLLGGVRLP